MVIRRRARGAEQKEERRGVILEAARRLLAQSEPEEVRMSAVAQGAGLAKGTLFLYFETKEALFLALLERDLAEWFDAVDTALDRVEGRIPVDRFVALACESLRRRPTMSRLLTRLETILERNIGFKTALRFKARVRERLLRTGSRLEEHLPFLEAGGGVRLLLRIHAVISGLMQQASPGPIMRRVHRKPGMDLFVIDFDSELRDILTALLRGTRHGTRPRRAK